MALSLTPEDLAAIQDAVLPAVATLQAVADRIKAKTDTISSGEITVRTPLLVTGELSVNAGDDYVAADGTGLVFDIADATHLMGLDQAGAEVQLRAKQVTWTATSVVSTASGYTATFEPTAAETAELNMSQSYQLHMLTPDGNEHSSTVRTLIVRQRVPEVEETES